MTFLLSLLLAPLIWLTLCLAIELVVGSRPLPSVRLENSVGLAATIIVPAHNEEALIAQTIAALKDSAADLAAILLVADNCTDSTAKLSKDAGVKVLERCDSVRRGKGFALDFARDHLSSRPPDIVLIIDADCSADSEAISMLIAACAATQRPCQAKYLQRPVSDAQPKLQLSTFAFFIKNVIRQRALQRLGGRAHLLGTGMAMPWELFAKAQLATGNIVEDLEMGLELARAGHAALLIEDAVVWSEPASIASTMEQRKRWEGGYLQSAAKWVPRVMAESLRSADFRGIWVAWSLLIPPLALLVVVDICAILVAVLLTWVFAAGISPAVILSGALTAAGAGLVFSWLSGGRQFISLASLGRMPLYLAWKIPMYLRLAINGAPKDWVRTGREGNSSDV